MSPSRRAVAGFAVLAAAMLVLPATLVVLGVLGWATVITVDAELARRPIGLRRALPAIVPRGLPVPLVVETTAPAAVSLRVRQPLGPDVAVEPAVAHDRLDAELVASRRGRHRLPAAVARATGPLGLGRWDHRGAGPDDLAVYPDVVTAHRLAEAVRRGRFAEGGLRARGPLGLGTDFESVREYTPDDDIRLVNWLATARLGRPMSNQYRVDQDRDVVCVVDCGRLMAAPLGPDRTRLDVTLDAVVAVAAVADVLGDRVGVVAFDRDVRRRLPPRRAGGTRLVEAVYDLEPSDVDSDYELAFRAVGGDKRGLVLVLTDLLEESAARPLVEAVPVLSRRHAVVIASVSDPDLTSLLTAEPVRPLDVYAAAVALDVLAARARVARRLTAARAEVVEAPPDRLAVACVGAYLGAKARARV